METGPLQCEGRIGPARGLTAQTMFVNPEGQTSFPLAGRRHGVLYVTQIKFFTAINTKLCAWIECLEEGKMMVRG